MRTFAVAVTVFVAAGLAAPVGPARIPSAPACHPNTVDVVGRANLDRDSRLERVLRMNASCSHEYVLYLEDRCRGRTRRHSIRGFGFLKGPSIVEANARPDGKELVVGFLPLRRGPSYNAGFGRVVVVKLARHRAGACPTTAYLFVHELGAPPPGATEADMAVEAAQIEPASASLEIRIVESFGRDGRRETLARYNSGTGRYVVYETNLG